ncbi:hypothetical protein GCM10012286_24210 [Streptomyces lasiicapitis]|uniref:Transposase n=1 Tax=Streptomyces lasiicapitis TaxID=1923961 RepID=A0ABQ2LSJ6_9ACTN|nr:hypothetical protein GCM10012286_24210 [Streptomyces lasiicapitis]
MLLTWGHNWQDRGAVANPPRGVRAGHRLGARRGDAWRSMIRAGYLAGIRRSHEAVASLSARLTACERGRVCASERGRGRLGEQKPESVALTRPAEPVTPGPAPRPRRRFGTGPHEGRDRYRYDAASDAGRGPR